MERENAVVQVGPLLLKDFLWFTFHISERERNIYVFEILKCWLQVPVKLLFKWDFFWWQCFVFFLIFGGHNSFLWDHWYPCFGLLVRSPRFQSQSGQPYLCLVESYVLHAPWDSSLVLPICGQHDNQADLFHIPASRHWWGLKPVPIVPKMNSLPTELCRLAYCFLSLCRIVFLCCHWHESMTSHNACPGFLL